MSKTCKNCGEVQRGQVYFRQHIPKLKPPTQKKGPVNIEPIHVYWSCAACRRKHNKDGSLYFPPARAKGGDADGP